ncbi:uncharacterized protein DNG_00346 [Cephalotrichum gorgonifer]|uniref:DNA polymerase V n=1 Tax=Cephalotrichum gorgonifer TaxID=2041049 RepID=A0AAE8SQT0_9PEZI|nr:uncharacterized protein DNG_00346 [Cephalotrichum gorgonifer]
MAKKRVASGEEAPAVPTKRMRRAKNPRDGMYKALDNFVLFPDQPDYEDHQQELALYQALGHKTRDLQLRASVVISKALVGQSGNEEPKEPYLTEVEFKRHLEQHLFPALTTGHAVSREGTFRVLSKVFSALVGERALTDSKYPSLSFDELLSSLVRHTTLANESTAGDDHDMGRLLGVRCLVQSDILSKDPQRWRQLLPLLLELAIKNSQLQQACGSIIADSVQTLGEKDASFTLDAVSETSIAKSAESLAIWVAALQQHPSLKSKTWSKPVSNKSAPGLSGLLKDSATKVLNENSSAAADNGKATWTSPLHFVWGKLATYFGKIGEDSLREFMSIWTPVVEEYLFAKNATDLQKARGFLIFQRMLQGIAANKTLAPAIFTRNFMSCLQNHAARKDRHLHTLAMETLAVIENVAAAEPKSVLPLLQGLLGVNGSYDFEQRTHSKTIEKIMKHTRAEDTKAVLSLLGAPFKKGSGGKDRLSASGNSYILYLYYLASSGSSAAMEKLCSLAFGGADVTSRYGLSDSAKATCKTQIESAFAKASRATGKFDHICQAVASMKPDSVVELNEEVASQQKQALKSLKGLLKKQEALPEGDDVLQAVALLHAVALFQVYSLATGAETLLAGVNTFAETFENEEGQETWQILIVKVLLPMVHRPSALGRLVAKHVFECFAPKLDPEAMLVLVERLEFSEDMTGYSQLLEDINAGDDSDDGEDDSGSDKGSDDEEALGSHLQDMEAEKEKKKPKHNGKKAEKEEEKKEEEEDEEDDGLGSDMSDSEMMAMDDTLVAAFKHLSGAGADTAEAKEAKTFVLNFKSRIIDLVEAYLQSQPRNTTVIFPTFPSLVALMARTSSSDLRARTVDILTRYRKRFLKERKRWVEESNGTDVKENLAVLEAIHDEMGSRDSAKFAKGASMACLTVAAAVVATDKDKIGELNRMHERLEGEMKGKRRKLHKSFFETWTGYQQSVCNGTEQT